MKPANRIFASNKCEWEKACAEKVFWGIGSILTIFAFRLKLDIASDGTIVRFDKSFQEYSIVWAFLVPILFCFYKFVSQINEEKKDRRNFFCCLLPALLFSFFIVMGYSYEKTSSWNLVVNRNSSQCLKALIAFSGDTRSRLSAWRTRVARYWTQVRLR